MQNINNSVQRFIIKHRITRRYIFIVVLLSVMVVAIVCGNLIFPAVSMSGELVCKKQQHTHSDECYEKVLICSETDDNHQHTNDCYINKSVPICGMNEDENHIHTNECFEDTNVLICDVPETSEHIHSDSCYEEKLICEIEEHSHSDECYKGDIEETIADAELVTEAENVTKKEENNIKTLVIDPIDAERDAVLKSVVLSGAKKFYTYSAYGYTTIISDASVDFGNYINDLTYKDVATSTTIPNCKTVKFTISYDIPEGTLLQDPSLSNRQIHVKLPDNTEITNELTGDVRQSGNTIGTYKITTDGYVIIEFDQNFVGDGQSQISGSIAFNANVKNDDADGSETVTIGCKSVNIPFDTSPESDLTVKKSYVKYDRNTKKVTYSIKISSINGTGSENGNLTVEDNILYASEDEIKLDWQSNDTVTFEKHDAEGNVSYVTANVNQTSNKKATISELPPLSANEYYYLEYTATLTPSPNKQIIDTSNKVLVSNGVISDEDKYDGQTVTDISIEKTGSYNNITDRLQWTIKIKNPFAESLENYTITDDMLGLTVDGISIKDKSGNVLEVLTIDSPDGTYGTLDASNNKITFKDTMAGEQYTLYYETMLPDRSTIAGDRVSNKVILKNEDDIVTESTANPYIGADRMSVGKQYKNAGFDSSGNVLIDWFSWLDCQLGDINGNSYKDTMSSDGNNHYMTYAQRSSLQLVAFLPSNDWQGTILTENADYTVKWYGLDGTIDVTDTTENAYSFEIFFEDNDKISKYGDIDFYYTSTGVTIGMAEESKIKFNNQAEFYQNSGSVTQGSAYYEYSKSKPFIKYDDTIGYSSKERTEHMSNELSRNANGDMILEWTIEANSSKNYDVNTDVTLTDTLPDGVTLDTNSVTYWKKSGNSYTKVADSEMTVNYDSNSNVITFEVPKTLHLSNPFRISYSVSFTEEYFMEKKDARGRLEFPNTVTDGNYTTTQTQIIERSLLSKTGSDPQQSADGYIDYTVDINEYGENLSTGETIKVHDVINYEWKNFVPTLYNVSVYEVIDNENGTKSETLMSPLDYNLTYSNDSVNAEFTLIVPDGKHLRIKYRYHCIYKNIDEAVKEQDTYDKKPGDYIYNSVNSPLVIDKNKVDWGIMIYNKVTVSYDNVEQSDDYENNYYLAYASSASAVTDEYIKIEKVNSDNFGLKLEGAEFAIYKWDETAWLPMTALPTSSSVGAEPEWGAESDTPYRLVTGSDGRVRIPNLKDGILYKIVELKAPNGYLKSVTPSYFSENAKPSSYPPDVTESNITVRLSGSIITIGNREIEPTDITVRKYWLDKRGFTGSHDDIEVELYQSLKAYDGTSELPDDAVLIETVTLSEDTSWICKWTDIPKTNEQDLPYYYYIKEKNSPANSNYQPRYEGNGINSGEISLTNKSNDYTNELPSTGGTGGIIPTIIGSSLALASAYILIKRRKI